MRPRLHVERAMDAEVPWDHPDGKFSSGASYPHCDPRILHLPTECRFCAEASWLQAERERLDVCNTGHDNRRWICPADRDRPQGSPSDYNRWGGNTRKP